MAVMIPVIFVMSLAIEPRPTMLLLISTIFASESLLLSRRSEMLLLPESVISLTISAFSDIDTVDLETTST
jgi:hypothetical protein